MCATYHPSPGRGAPIFCDGTSGEPEASRFRAFFDDSATCDLSGDRERFGVTGAGVMDGIASTISREPPSTGGWGNRHATLANGSGPAKIRMTRSVKSWNLIFPSVTEEQDRKTGLSKPLTQASSSELDNNDQKSRRHTGYNARALTFW